MRRMSVEQVTFSVSCVLLGRITFLMDNMKMARVCLAPPTPPVKSVQMRLQIAFATRGLYAVTTNACHAQSTTTKVTACVNRVGRGPRVSVQVSVTTNANATPQTANIARGCTTAVPVMAPANPVWKSVCSVIPGFSNIQRQLWGTLTHASHVITIYINTITGRQSVYTV